LNFGNLANSLRGLWEELVERRLWPVAIALVVALVALPVLLAKPAGNAPAPAPASPATGTPSSPLAAFQPAVSLGGKKSSEIRKDLSRFHAKDPFAPKGASFSGSSAAGTATVTGTTGASGVAAVAGDTGSSGAGTTTTDTGIAPTGSSGSPSGSSGSQGGSTGVTYYTYTADVRFGKTGEDKAMTLTRFRALPTTDNPIVVFMGVRNDGETAVFLVSASATTTGDGDCRPSEDACTFLYMKRDDKQTIETVGTDGSVVDYDLELTDVNVKKTEGPNTAKSSRKAKVSSKARSADKSRNRLNFGHALRSFERVGF
jgi:hypothetical protein